MQRIECPGCYTVFNSASGWLHHIESHECTTIFPSHLEAQKKKNEQFANALARLDINQSDGSKGIDLSKITDTWGDDPTLKTLDGYDNLEPHHGTTVDQEYKKSEDFPRLSTQAYRAADSKQLDLLTGDAPGPKPMQPTNAWSQKKQLFPGQVSRRSVPPSSTSVSQPGFSVHSPVGQKQPFEPKDRNAKVQVAQLPRAVSATPNPRGPTPHAAPLSKGRVVDPDDPDFNAGQFYNSILEQFKCPHQCK